MNGRDKALGELVRAELARQSLVEFSARMDERYQRAKHLDFVCRHFEALVRRDIDRIILCLHPRGGKSRALTDLVAWNVGLRPRDQVIYASYAAELAEQQSRRARGLLEDERYPFATRVDPASAASDRWGTTSNGLVRALGVGGGLTGFGGDLLIVDDAFRDQAEAESAVARDAVFQWFQSTARTRLEMSGVIIVAGVHWHQDDLIGRILNSPGAARWTRLIIPAIAEDAVDILGRAVGEPMWPERFPVSELPSVEAGELSSRQWSALYQQRPTSAEGSLFKASWFSNRYSTLPTEAPEPSLEDQMRWANGGMGVFETAGRRARLITVTGIDTASKTGCQNDHSVLCTVAFDVDRHCIYVVDLERGRWEYNDLCRHVVASFERHRPAKLFIEDSSAGTATIQELRRVTNLPIVAVLPKGSKIGRAEAITPICEAGRVHLPQSAPWVDVLLNELCAFPFGRFDDCVDSLVLAVTHLRKAVAATRERQQMVSQEGGLFR